jgi:hypothetical protein
LEHQQSRKGITMVNDRMMMRVAMLFALAALPSLASSQAPQSSQVKAPDWYGKEVTQITIDGSSEQLKAFQEGLQKTFIQSGFADTTIYQSPVSKKKLAYWYLTETEKKFGEPTVSAFYSALQSSAEKTKDAKKPPVMHTSIVLAFTCRPKTCAGQQLLSPKPPCDC